MTGDLGLFGTAVQGPSNVPGLPGDHLPTPCSSVIIVSARWRISLISNNMTSCFDAVKERKENSEDGG